MWLRNWAKDWDTETEDQDEDQGGETDDQSGETKEWGSEIDDWSVATEDRSVKTGDRGAETKGHCTYPPVYQLAHFMQLSISWKLLNAQTPDVYHHGPIKDP